MKNTLKSAADFRAARRGRYRKLSVGTLILSKGDSTKYGVTVPNSVGKAVERQRIKRRARAVIVPVLDNLPNGTVVLFYPSRNVLSVDFEKLDRELKTALKV